MNRFFLMAGGLGKRARPLSLFRPKPLFPLNGIPLIDRMLVQLRQIGLNRGYINLHHKAEQLRGHLRGQEGIDFIYENRLTGNRVLNRIPDSPAGNYLLMLNGDVCLDIPYPQMLARARRTRSDGVLLVQKTRESGYRALKVENGFFRGRGRMSGVSPRSFLRFCGVILLRTAVARAVDETNIFDFLEKHKLKVAVHPLRSFWLDIGTPRRYWEADRVVGSRESPGSTNSLSPGAVVSGDSGVFGSILWDGARVTGSRIHRCILTDQAVLCQRECSDRIITPQTGGGIKYHPLL